jgi:pimeloyl-ACP methyl ester carboxylesterase
VFDGFALDRVRVGDVSLRVRHGGSGPPVVLLHGHPRTHTTWRRVAPLLAVWRPWAPRVVGQPIDCGHHLAEEAPEQLAAALVSFVR